MQGQQSKQQQWKQERKRAIVVAAWSSRVPNQPLRQNKQAGGGGWIYSCKGTDKHVLGGARDAAVLFCATNLALFTHFIAF
eukprot:1006448-Pelagomonas_calceolata.AAC.6